MPVTKPPQPGQSGNQDPKAPPSSAQRDRANPDVQATNDQDRDQEQQNQTRNEAANRNPQAEGLPGLKRHPVGDDVSLRDENFKTD